MRLLFQVSSPFMSQDRSSEVRHFPLSTSLFVAEDSSQKLPIECEPRHSHGISLPQCTDILICFDDVGDCMDWGGALSSPFTLYGPLGWCSYT